jgi:HlyD family secretion protein
MRPHKNVLWGGIAGISLILLLSSCTPKGDAGAAAATSETASTAKPAEDPKLRVRVVRAKIGALEAKRTVSGTLEALLDSQVSSNASAKVLNILQREGAKVQKGQVIVQLEDAALREAQRTAELQLQTARVNLSSAQKQNIESQNDAVQALKTAQANLQSAQQTWSANQKLYALQGISASEFKTSQIGYLRATAELASSKNSLAKANRAGSENLELLNIAVQQAQVGLQTAQRNLSDAQIKAPFSGLISEMNAVVGQNLAAGSSTFRLIDPSSLRVKFNVSAQEGERLATGMPVNVLAGGKLVVAQIFRSTPALAQNRQRSFYAKESAKESDKEIGSSDFASSPVGASVQVSYATQLAKGVQIPAGALELSGDGTGSQNNLEGNSAGNQIQSRVYLVQNGKIVAKVVRVVAESGGLQVVTGLTEGDLVIFPRSSRVQAGLAVEVVK